MACAAENTRRHIGTSTLAGLLAATDAELARIDPVAVNLAVAVGIPALERLDICAYQKRMDVWADDLRQRLPKAEAKFHKTPGDWEGDIRLFRLGVVCWYISSVLGVRYRDDQREAQTVAYCDPADLFLYGVMDSRLGTCANMAVLFLALIWRLRWPVHLVVASNHLFCRFEDGKVRYNVEATNFERGFRVPGDDYYRKQFGVPDVAVRCGSDLRSLTPRETLAWYLGLRGRHCQDVGNLESAEVDYLRARALFPKSRRLYEEQIGVSIQLSQDRFQPDERGHYLGVANWLQRAVAAAGVPDPGFAMTVGG
jgi:hypothetical protein